MSDTKTIETIVDKTVAAYMSDHDTTLAYMSVRALNGSDSQNALPVVLGTIDRHLNTELASRPSGVDPIAVTMGLVRFAMELPQLAIHSEILGRDALAALATEMVAVFPGPTGARSMLDTILAYDASDLAATVMNLLRSGPQNAESSGPDAVANWNRALIILAEAYSRRQNA